MDDLAVVAEAATEPSASAAGKANLAPPVAGGFHALHAFLQTPFYKPPG
jgi:hypothetical protein